jgi:conjugative transfer signal peptidase TraF
MRNSSHNIIQAIKNKKWLCIVMFVFVVLMIVSKSLGALINITPSMPIGLYIRADGSLSRGDVIAFCLSESYQTIGLKQGYLAKGHVCHGADPLIKQVLAIPGDDVLLTNQSIQVNGITYHYPTHYTDSQGRTLAIYPRGNYKHAVGYWVIGNHSADSWDSRYWGSINAKQIRYKLRSVFVF